MFKEDDDGFFSDKQHDFKQTEKIPKLQKAYEEIPQGFSIFENDENAQFLKSQKMRYDQKLQERIMTDPIPEEIPIPKPAPNFRFCLICEAEFLNFHAHIQTRQH